MYKKHIWTQKLWAALLFWLKSCSIENVQDVCSFDLLILLWASLCSLFFNVINSYGMFCVVYPSSNIFRTSWKMPLKVWSIYGHFCTHLYILEQNNIITSIRIAFNTLQSMTAWCVNPWVPSFLPCPTCFVALPSVWSSVCEQQLYWPELMWLTVTHLPPPEYSRLRFSRRCDKVLFYCGQNPAMVTFSCLLGSSRCLVVADSVYSFCLRQEAKGNQIRYPRIEEMFCY